jgi:hypothetical protein
MNLYEGFNNNCCAHFLQYLIYLYFYTTKLPFLIESNQLICVYSIITVMERNEGVKA